MDAAESTTSAVGESLGTCAACSPSRSTRARPASTPERLHRIDRHYQRYVDEGKLPGFLARDRARRPARAHRQGRATATSRPALPVERRHAVPHLLDDEADHVGRGDAAVGGGRVRAQGPGRALHPRVQGRARVGGRQPEQARSRVPAREPVRMWHLLTHTAGLTYGFHYAEPLDGIYRDHGFEFGSPKGMDLEQCTDAWARAAAALRARHGVQLLRRHRRPGPRRSRSSPASRWTCSCKERIFDPLGMTDTAFGDADPDRLRRALRPGAGAQRPHGLGRVRRAAVPLGRRRARSRTAADYHRFTAHAAGGGSGRHRCSEAVRCASWAATTCPAARSSRRSRGRRSPRPRTRAWASGSGSRVVLDPARTKTLCSEGELAWGGLASTAFWVDPKERITAQFFTQLAPSSTYPLRSPAAPADLRGAAMKAKLVGVVGSHPCVSAELMLRYKGIEFTPHGPAEHVAQGDRCRCCATAARPCR